MSGRPRAKFGIASWILMAFAIALAAAVMLARLQGTP
jgi:hypothetical protein